MSCIYKSCEWDGDYCNHPSKRGATCSEYACSSRTDSTPRYNSDTNQFEKVIDGKTVKYGERENPKTTEIKTSCNVCNFKLGPNQEVVYMGNQGGTTIEACLIPPSPISLRKNPDKPAILQMFIDMDDCSGQIEIPIAYCPICGRKL